VKNIIHESIITAQAPLGKVARNPKAPEPVKSFAQKVFVELASHQISDWRVNMAYTVGKLISCTSTSVRLARGDDR
jgi:hypothetical protein